MRIFSLILGQLISRLVFAQSSSTYSTSTAPASSTTSPSSAVQASSSYVFGTLLGSVLSTASPSVPTGTYVSYASQITVTTAASTNSSGNAAASLTTQTLSTSNSLLLVGTISTIGTNGTATTTVSTTTTTISTAATATNTVPCNNYPEFCGRQYSNITEVCAHNFAFVRAGNAASNQAIEVLGQLNDGVRMLSTESHYVNDTIYLCHTSCELLNVGTLESALTTIRQWVDVHPYDVVSILLVNSNFIDVNNYTAPIVNSGLSKYAYIPPKIPMRLQDWPTLSELILSQKRVVIFMDYQANQTAVPYILDEFSQMWETPFSPTDPSFPCTEQRPPSLPPDQALDRLYLANHNLNVDISILGTTILIPNFAALVEVNAANGSSPSLGAMADDCVAEWAGRPPNFLLVDYYNEGNGSVFEVAAKLNNVTYSRPCCGEVLGFNVAGKLSRPPALLILAVIILLVGYS